MFLHQVSATSLGVTGSHWGALAPHFASLAADFAVTHNPPFVPLPLIAPSLPGNEPFIAGEVACPSTWVKFRHACYDFEPVVQKLTFEESREHCRQKGGTP